MSLDIRPILVVTGYALLVLAAAMAPPLLLDLTLAGDDWPAFLIGMAVSGFFGLAMLLSARGDGRHRMHTREAFLATVCCWAACGIAAAIPLAAGSLHLHPVDALFEAVSGLTTTGATVIAGLDTAPAAVLLWRAMLNWLGGAGIIVTAIAVLPVLRVGGMQLFRIDPADPGDGAMPRLSRLAKAVLIAYPAMTAVLIVGFAIAGMNALDAVCHAMSTLATGGFSTSDQSFGHFSEGARWVAVVGMIAGATTFTLFIEPWRGGGWSTLKDSQARRFLILLVAASLVLTLWNWGTGRMEVGEALRRSTFNAVSVLTTSGFHWGDYDSWGGFAQVAFFMMMFLGGCTGSAAGGIKVFRFEVLLAAARIQIRRLLHPHGVFEIELNNRRVTQPVVRSVASFVMLYLICEALLAVALAATGLDATTSFSGAAAALGNVGPGLGPLIGPGAGYHALPAAAKWLLTAGMLVGRLELATVLVLFAPGFWRN